MNKLRDFQKAMEMLVPQGPAKNIDEAKKKHYQFWDTQPVPKLGKQNFPIHPSPNKFSMDIEAHQVTSKYRLHGQLFSIDSPYSPKALNLITIIIIIATCSSSRLCQRNECTMISDHNKVICTILENWHLNSCLKG